MRIFGGKEGVSPKPPEGYGQKLLAPGLLGDESSTVSTANIEARQQAKATLKEIVRQQSQGWAEVDISLVPAEKIPVVIARLRRK